MTRTVHINRDRLWTSLGVGGLEPDPLHVRGQPAR